jgi:hypothetical protein
VIVLIDYFLTPLHWENRYQYLELMEDFSDGRISGEQFKIKFFKVGPLKERLTCWKKTLKG